MGREGQSKEKRENKWISRVFFQWAEKANLRKKKKTNGLVGSKTGGGEGQPKEKRENKWISRVLNSGQGGPT